MAGLISSLKTVKNYYKISSYDLSFVFLAERTTDGIKQDYGSAQADDLRNAAKLARENARNVPRAGSAAIRTGSNGWLWARAIRRTTDRNRVCVIARCESI